MREHIISKMQNSILQVIASNDGATSDDFHKAVFGVPFERSERVRTLTSSERASLSRAIRRLELRGLIYRQYRRWWKLTDDGRREMQRRGVECRDRRKMQYRQGDECYESGDGRLDELETQLAGAMCG